MESRNSGAILNLLESGGCESSSGDREQLEHLRNRIRDLESENIELTRIQQHIIATYGKDCTIEFSKLINDFQTSKNNCEHWENEYRKLYKDYSNAMHQIDQQKLKIGEIERKAMDLEEENSRLRELIHDLRSVNHRLQLQTDSQHNNRSFNEFHNSRDINTMKKKSTKSKSDSIRGSFLSATLVLAIFTLLFVIFVHIYIFIHQQH